VKQDVFSPTKGQLLGLYDVLMQEYGHQAWWPADSRFEVMVGAVLTQNTAWTNVEKAIVNLKAADALSTDRILAMDEKDLASLIRPSGYYNIKARRLKHLCAALAAGGGEAALDSLPTPQLRHLLLAINGVGPETADDILLYGFARPVFVIDAYTRRLLQRFHLAGGDEPYESLRAGFERALPADTTLFKEYHALIVQHAKLSCGSRPRCDGCALSAGCPTACDQSITV